MNNYKHFVDNLDRRGFMSKESILNSVSQEEIFELVFKFRPQEYEYVVSPLRTDKAPGCWFSYHTNGVLYFIDFGHKRTHSDCFNIVQDYFGFANFYLTLEYIHKSLIQGKIGLLPVRIVDTPIIKKREVKILTEARCFIGADRDFWSQYEIKKSDLIEDRVFPIQRLYLLNTKSGSHIVECKDLAYSYNDFEKSRKKVYFPLREGKRRFLTNCTKNDVGGINSLLSLGNELLITKSYKDYRVLKNNGKNVVWFQNEGMIPIDSILTKLISSFRRVLVWFDNDEPGIQASGKVVDYINTFVPNKAKSIHLPERSLEYGIKDPSDCIAKDKNLFKQFLKDFTH